MKKIKYLIIISILAVAIGGIFSINRGKLEVQSSEVKEPTKVDITTIQIDQHALCRNVVNAGTKSIAIGIKTKDEWCSFVKAVNEGKVRGVSFTNCESCWWTGCVNNPYNRVCAAHNLGACP